LVGHELMRLAHSGINNGLIAVAEWRRLRRSPNARELILTVGFEVLQHGILRDVELVA
jgi:hypothetical protein